MHLSGPGGVVVVVEETTVAVEGEVPTGVSPTIAVHAVRNTASRARGIDPKRFRARSG